jgi:hypothetical protein
MNIDRCVLAIAGSVVLAGLVLGAWLHPYWYFLSTVAGLNLLQASFTGFCPAAILLKKLGVPPGNAFD